MTFRLELFDPTAFRRTAELFSRDVPHIVRAARQIVKDDEVLESLADLEIQNDGHQAVILNDVFLEMARERSWDLDKSLHFGLETAFRSVSPFSPLKRKFVDFLEADIDLPENVQGAECGLFLVWSSEKIHDCLPAVHQFKCLADVEAVVGNSAFSRIGRLTGAPWRARAALKRVVQNDYLNHYWQNFREAIMIAAQGKYLGFSMW